MSISSSSHWPRVGLSILGLLLVGDALFFRVYGPWEDLAALMGVPDEKLGQPWRPISADVGTVHDHLALQRLAESRDYESLVLVFGTSRAEQGFRPNLVRDRIPDGQRIVMLAHPQMFGTEIRSASREFSEFGADIVVLAISEWDTHTVVRLDDRVSFRDLATWREVGQLMGRGYLLENRIRLYRIVVGDVASTYRFRGVLGKLGFNWLRRFKQAKPPDTVEPPEVPRRRRLAEAKVIEAFETEVRGRELLQESESRDVEKRIRNFERFLPLTRTLAPGRDARTLMELFRRTVQTYRDAGSQVLILELPVHPWARPLYPATCREEFLDFTEELERDLGVITLRLEDQPEYGPSDFYDVTHLEDWAALRLTRFALGKIESTLASAAGQESSIR